MGWNGLSFADLGGREYILIMNSDYNEGANYDDTNFGLQADVLWGIWPQVASNHRYLETPFTLSFYYGKPFGYNPGDSYIFSTTHTKIEDNNNLPEKFTLNPSYPNPFNPVTNIRFQIPSTGKTKVVIYNALGQKIKTLYSGQMNAGEHTLRWDASGNASGMYFVVVRFNGKTAVQKMMLIK